MIGLLSGASSITQRPRRSALAILLCCFALGFAATAPVHAVQPNEMLADPKLEARARAISAGLRCLVCQNQSIDDSDAPLARDLRLIVRERIQAGDTDEAVRTYLVNRFGEFVLLKPPLSAATVFLWLAPLLLLVAAGFAGYRQMTARTSAGSRDSETPLSDEEARRLSDLLDRER